MIKQNEEDKIGEQMLKQNERERDRVHETFEICLRAMIINQMEKRGGNAGGNPLNLMSSLISTGIVILVQTFDAVGNTSFRYELRKTANTLPLMHTSRNGYDNPAVVESLKKIEEKLDKRNEIIMKYIEVSERKKNIKRAESLRRLDDLFNPPHTFNIESRRLEPEDRRLDIHHDILERREERDNSRYKLEHELKQKGESWNQDQGVRLFPSNSDMVTNEVSPGFIAMFQGQNVTLQMPESLLKEFGRLMGQGRQPQQKQPPQVITILPLSMQNDKPCPE
jgi:hypothetical protein